MSLTPVKFVFALVGTMLYHFDVTFEEVSIVRAFCKCCIFTVLNFCASLFTNPLCFIFHSKFDDVIFLILVFFFLIVVLKFCCLFIFSKEKVNICPEKEKFFSAYFAILEILFKKVPSSIVDLKSITS